MVPTKRSSVCRGRSNGLRCVVTVLAVLSVSAPAAFGVPSVNPARQLVVKIVAQIQRADYEGDRAALQRLYGELTPFVDDKELASRVLYWRGFASWRRAINGFNDSVDPKELEQDLTDAGEEFKKAIAADPNFVDAKIAVSSCLSIRIGLTPNRLQELVTEARPFVKDARAAEPDNPRLLWVLGPNLWNTPPERGGGQDKAIESYLKGLESVRKPKATAADPLDPSWGEPELLMSLGWSYLNRATPDLNAAERNARAALQLVPYWHYVRDILLPQIQKAQSKS